MYSYVHFLLFFLYSNFCKYSHLECRWGNLKIFFPSIMSLKELCIYYLLPSEIWKMGNQSHYYTICFHHCILSAQKNRLTSISWSINSNFKLNKIVSGSNGPFSMNYVLNRLGNSCRNFSGSSSTQCEHGAGRIKNVKFIIHGHVVKYDELKVSKKDGFSTYEAWRLRIIY